MAELQGYLYKCELQEVKILHEAKILQSLSTTKSSVNNASEAENKTFLEKTKEGTLCFRNKNNEVRPHFKEM